MSNIIECLEKRGLIDQLTSEEIKKECNKTVKFYLGIDPTADSLHLGHLVGVIILCWFRKFGHVPFALVGGATAKVGDPSGKSMERPFLEESVIEKNVEAISHILKNVLNHSGKGPKPTIVNNSTWLSKLSFIEFLRDVGKHFRVGTMLGKESVRIRLDSADGMSLTEFCYQVLQSYDFYYLSTHHGVTLQIGGSDQWGNITAGIDLSRKISSQSLHGLTFPLLTRSDGSKFGKTESGTIWLSSNKTSVYEFYQYLIKVPDSDVIRFMKMLTFMELEEIEKIEKQMQESSYIPNEAQKRLAEEVTKLVHGEEGLEIALRVTKGAAPGKKAVLSAEILEEIAKDMPHCDFSKEEVIGKKYVDIAASSKLVSSKSEAARLIKNGGAYLNNEKILDSASIIEEKHLIDQSYLLLGMGKKKKLLIKIV